MDEIAVAMPIKATPYEHQKKAFYFVSGLFGLRGNPQASDGAALLMEMGTGKTITTIAILGALYNAGEVKKALVVAPLSILSVWIEELAKYAAFDYTAVPLLGSSTKKIDTLRHFKGAGLNVAVINYDSLSAEKGNKRIIEAALTAWHPDVIVADESTRIKNPTALQSLAMHRLGDIASYKLMLTGSPVTRTPLDFWSQYRFVNKAVLGISYYGFRGKYAIQKEVARTNNGRVISNWEVPESRMKLLAERVHSIAYRVTKDEALDLPPFTDVTLKVKLEPAAQKIYSDLNKDMVALLGQGEISVTNILAKITRLAQCTGGFLVPDADNGKQKDVEVVSHAKLKALEDIIDNILDSGGKLVIFTHFIPELLAIGELLDGKYYTDASGERVKGIPYAMVRGGDKERNDIEMERFKQDDVRFFIATMQTASMGLTLTQASTMVFYSMTYNFNDYIQARARIHRISQKNACTYIHLIAECTIDEDIMAATEKKDATAKTLVDELRKKRGVLSGR